VNEGVDTTLLGRILLQTAGSAESEIDRWRNQAIPLRSRRTIDHCLRRPTSRS